MSELINQFGNMLLVGEMALSCGFVGAHIYVWAREWMK